MENGPDIEFEKLNKISKYLFPILLTVTLAAFYSYKNSVDILEINIVAKETEFDDYQIYYITSDNETLLTTEEIYSSLELRGHYIVAAKGWKFTGSHRKLIDVYRKTL